MQKNMLVYLCIVSSLAGMALIYIAAVNTQAQIVPIEDIAFDMVGYSVKTSGFITYRTDHDNGHIFLTIIDDESKISVPLFSSFVSSYEQDNSQLATTDDLRKGALIEVEGVVGEYNGQLQIVPQTADDLKILYD